MKKLNEVLLIEDNKATSYFNRLLIQEMDICDNIHVVCDGEEGIEYLYTKSENPDSKFLYPCPDLILLDINMHGMDGFDFLNAYQNLKPQQIGNSKILMLSSSQLESEKVQSSGYSQVKGFVTKPLTEESIKEILDEHFS